MLNHLNIQKNHRKPHIFISFFRSPNGIYFNIPPRYDGSGLGFEGRHMGKKLIKC